MSVPMIAFAPFIMIIAVVGLMVLGVLAVIWLITRGGNARQRGDAQTDAMSKALRDWTAKLDRLEQRLANLETIVIDREGRSALDREFDALQKESRHQR